MKNLFLFFIAQIYALQLQAQHFAISNDQFNIVYLGIDNPLSIAVENLPCKSIVLKVENGRIAGNNCQYIFIGEKVGAAYITIYKKSANNLIKIGKYAFRVKRIPAPVFKIGPYGSDYESDSTRKVQKVVLAAQQFVRAEIECCGFEAKATIKSFSVKIFYADSAKSNIFFNETGKINEQIRNAFSELKKEDVVFFHKIFAIGPDGLQWKLDPLILTIEN